MPTHKGTSQTDITIGSGGTTAATNTTFEFDATYATVGNLQFTDLTSSTDRRYSAYELRITSATGSVLATFAARYRAWIDSGSSTGPRVMTRSDSFTPAASGSTPTWPASPMTTAERTWGQAVFDGTGSTFATLRANWQLRTTVATGGTIIQTIVDQTDPLLRVHLVYMSGSTVLLDNVVTMTASGAIKGRLTLDPPDVTDVFVP